MLETMTITAKQKKVLKTVIAATLVATFAIRASPTFALDPIRCDAAPHISDAMNFRATTSMLGSTPAEIHHNFPAVIENNFQSGNAATIIGRLSDQELSHLVTLYKAANQGRVSRLIKIVAEKSDVTTQSRFMGAVDSAPRQFSAPSNFVERAATVPSASTKSAASPGLGQLVGIEAASSTGLDNTLYEIYLDFRTAPIGSLSPASALVETAIFAATKTSVAAAFGYTLGTAINTVIETYDPSLEDAIGGTVAGMVDQLEASVSELAQGKIESGLATLFGVSADFDSASSEDGDYGVTDSLGDYDSSGGGSPSNPNPTDPGDPDPGDPGDGGGCG